jgi:hypothetical protein
MELSAETKHHILLEHEFYSRDRSFRALADRHGVEGGKRTLQGWFARWDGSPESLEHRPGAGRPRLMPEAIVNEHVKQVIQDANRSHTAIHYPEIAQRVEEITGIEVSARTMRRYGHDDLGARQQATQKRTSEECKHIFRVNELVRVSGVADEC